MCCAFGLICFDASFFFKKKTVIKGKKNAPYSQIKISFALFPLRCTTTISLIPESTKSTKGISVFILPHFLSLPFACLHCFFFVCVCVCSLHISSSLSEKGWRRGCAFSNLYWLMGC